MIHKERTTSTTVSLPNKILLYDSDCPMCQAYSGAFVGMGLLKRENRMAFNSIGDETFGGKMDAERSKNEIPLIDTAGGPTLYGTDAMIAILSHRWAFFRIFQTNGTLNYLSKRAYSFISYNRKVIVPAPKRHTVDCSPSLHIPYRIIFILLALAMGCLLLQSTFPQFTSEGGWIISVSLLMLQIMAALLISRSKWFDYVGNLAMVWLMQGILLLAITRIPVLSTVLFAPLAFAMVYFEHHRRTKILRYPFPLNITWLLAQSTMWIWLAWVGL